VEGRRIAALPGAHGVNQPQGQQADAERGDLQGRFGRMFSPRRAFDDSDEAIDQLVALMLTRAPSEHQAPNFGLPAGYTYLGQFVDHDITFDPVSRRDRHNVAEALVDFRTPRYDLDSVYGAGPAVQPYLYDWKTKPRGTRLLLRRGAGASPDDLPRNAQRIALIGDPRNDDNVIVSQLHLLFVKFHNAVVEELICRGEVGERDLLPEAQRIVRWHYQWIVLHEFLPAVTGHELPKKREHFLWSDRPFIPVEFSGAAYRFGHSMIRNTYVLQMPREDTPGDSPPQKPIFPSLKGQRRLPNDLEIDWERFFKFKGLEADAQLSFTIDTCMARPLFNLDLAGETTPLARRNLERGRALGLPSGQEVAEEMHLAPLPEAALRLDEDALAPRERKALVAATPLWYYILCEAEHEEEGNQLGTMGGRIVAEVLAGLAEGDPSSFRSQQPDWEPELGTADPEHGGKVDFTMVDLITFVRKAEGA